MSSSPLRFRVHNLDHARCAIGAARAAGRPVVLESPAAAAGWQGIGWWRRLRTALEAEFGPVALVLDCADAPGHALAALRDGCRAVRLAAPAATLQRVAAIARAYGAALETTPAQAIDLLDAADPAAICRRALGA